jgi:hypothetical protein
VENAVVVAVDGILLKGIYTMADVCSDVGYAEITVKKWCEKMGLVPYRIRNGTRILVESQAQMIRDYARQYGRWGYHPRIK